MSTPIKRSAKRVKPVKALPSFKCKSRILLEERRTPMIPIDRIIKSADVSEVIQETDSVPSSGVLSGNFKEQSRNKFSFQERLTIFGATPSPSANSPV